MRQILKNIYRLIQATLRAKQFGYYAPTATTGKNVKIYNKKNAFLYDNVSLKTGTVIMNTRAKFIVKKWSGAAINLVVITGNHMSIPGLRKIDVTDDIKDKYDEDHKYDKDVIIDEDVHIGANVTLLSGVHIGRGAIVGACSVVTKNVKPYAVVVGNPAHQISTRFTINEILYHESKIYPENERLKKDMIESLFDGEKVKR